MVNVANASGQDGESGTDDVASTSPARMPRQPSFLLGWCDPDPNKPIEAKVAEALAHYAKKYQQAGNLVFVAPELAAAVHSVRVVASRRCSPSVVFVGRLEDAD